MNPNTRLTPITDKKSWSSCPPLSVGDEEGKCGSFFSVRECTPSGIITANAVPTNKPAPNTVIFFNFS